MRAIIKSILSFFANKTVSFGFRKDMQSHYYRMRLFLLDSIISSLFSRVRTEKIGNQSITFSVPNYISDWRAQTSSLKEPDTIEWINRFKDKSIFWDIGANVGIFSLYAAKAKSSIVLSFEPSVFNLELLSRNINLNHLQDNITVIPIPLSSDSEISKLNLSNTTWAGALSTFKENFGWDGKPLKSTFSIQMFGATIDDLVSLFNLQPPDYIKIDVDGLEHLILQGGKNTLANAKSILIEVNTDFVEQESAIQSSLKAAGFELETSSLSAFEPDNADKEPNQLSVYNQIWSRN